MKRKVRILSVSYDEVLLGTRHMLLEAQGYEVVSAVGLQSSLELCKRGGFDIFILGHSIPHGEKLELVETFHLPCPGVVIALRRPDEPPVKGADYQIEPDPGPLLKLIEHITDNRGDEGSSLGAAS